MTASQDLIDLALQLKLATDATIDVTTQRIVQAWSTAWDEIAQEDLAAAAEDGQWPTRSQIARNVRAQAALQATAAKLQELVAATQAAVTGDLDELVQTAAVQHSQLLAAQLPAGYQLPAAVYDKTAVELIVARTTRQVTALTWPLQPEAAAAMRASLIRGMQVGDNPRRVAADMLKRVQGVFDGGRARAENIARTEMIDAYRAASQEREKAAADVLQGWVWVCALTERSCISCISQHGQQFPPDQEGPLDHPSGRCARAPVTKTWKELGFNIEEPPRAIVETGEEWFNRQPEATQKTIMGPKRHAAYKAGDYPPEAWSVRRDNPEWRTSYGVGPVPSGR